jgi:hypothetical protein
MKLGWIVLMLALTAAAAPQFDPDWPAKYKKARDAWENKCTPLFGKDFPPEQLPLMGARMPPWMEKQRREAWQATVDAWESRHVGYKYWDYRPPTIYESGAPPPP